MSSKLSFSIAVKLLTDNFKKGSASVKSYLRSMQMQFMSFAAAVGGGAIGLSNFVSKLMETAKETSRVNIALKNVSKSTEEYADHQKFIIGLSKKYGVQVNSPLAGLPSPRLRRIFRTWRYPTSIRSSSPFRGPR